MLGLHGAASVAEGATKPESAISWIERTCRIEKVADSIPVTKEALADIFFVQGEIRRLLEINLALKVDDLLYDGDGVTPNIKGVYTSALRSSQRLTRTASQLQIFTI